MHLDLCRRSPAAALGFCVVLVLLHYYPVIKSPSFFNLYMASGMIALAASLGRLFLSLKITSMNIEGLRKWGRLHIVLIFLNSTFLGLICCLAFYDPLNSDINIFLTSFILSAVMAGSTSSIALIPPLQIYLLVMMGALPALLLELSTHTGNLPYHLWPLLIFTFIIYVYGNSKQFYKNMVFRYETEEALTIEKTNLTLTIEKLQATQGELLSQKARAEYTAKLASLGEMAGGVAHEINTPLNVILLLTEQQHDIMQSEPFDGTAMTKSITKIEETTNRIAKIVRGLRTFARDGQKDPIETVPLQLIIENTLALCLEKFKLNNIEIRMTEPFPEVNLQCRPVQVSQVFLNILNNASEAISVLPEKWISIDVRKLRHAVEIRFTDSGHGIPSDIESKIFGPFFTTKEIGKGTGLGLSISRGLVEEHQGQMFLDSSGRHTSFVVRLPTEL